MQTHDRPRKFSIQNGHRPAGRFQAGNLTIFTAVFVLILLTLVLVYSTQVGLFEQRVSANEANQKAAFHMAESAIDQGMEYMLANGGRIFSGKGNAIQFGPNSFRAGWFANDGVNPGWAPCTAALIAKSNHPCGSDGNPSIRAATASFFYDDPKTAAGTSTGADSLPLNFANVQANATARLTAVLCIINPDDPDGGCQGKPTSDDETNDALAIIQLMGYGFADCADTNDPSTCRAEARIARPVSNFKNTNGGPGVPLVTRTTFPPTGTFSVVGNPNGGGVGVALTSWLNDNPACRPPTDIKSSGTWQTCQLQDWYHTDSLPTGTTCTDNNCYCGYGGNDTSYFMSWRHSSDTNIGIDIVVDEAFPCDLFEYYFGVDESLYTVVKSNAQQMSDCSGLGPYSSGLIWISGPKCDINSNTQVGTPDNPVLLVSAASETKINGGANIYGLFYAFDGEDPNACLELVGGATVYGAMVVDNDCFDKSQGDNSIVWAQGVMAKASGINGVGSVSGGWRDFGLPAWQ